VARVQQGIGLAGLCLAVLSAAAHWKLVDVGAGVENVLFATMVIALAGLSIIEWRSRRI